ncbi:hypothetical protein [Ramlibacter rhizophilus]|uniref:Uncharacterized protein n=1 Tax=Ramlibacter rhizophilus TaxID=1781167 RepID=A0A4Z0BH18_9BURK|nr:hypothetical protein [Ramlibacter rhizophilus]TFY98626.1 hypothetical protein EZ242_13935 [Ramlibacter rhizophilus]
MSAGVPTRPPELVMTPERIAAIVPTPLSFPRSAMRELVRGRWKVHKLRFDLDDEGRGEVLYQLEGAGWLFHFFLIAQKLDEAQKTDRNFAASWDAMGVLCQGEWTPEREARLRREVPRQRAGLADYDTLMYARGNRSARVFDPVVDSLARGEQPDLRLIAPVGYILRTTAFIGNGQLGTRAFAGLEPNHPLRRPYHAQFCSGFMLREYVFDLVDHLARVRDPRRAVRLAPAWRRYIGLGNSAATGLAAFAANHPHLMHQWTQANEAALTLARERAADPDAPSVHRFAELLDKAIRHFEEGAREDDGVFLAPQALARELARMRPLVREFRDAGTLDGAPADRPWARLCEAAAARLAPEALAVVQALVLEVHPDIVERFRDAFFADERLELDPAMRAGELAAILDARYRWALDASDSPGAGHYFWYRCASAPRDVRRGPRGRAPEHEHETTLDTARQVRRLREQLASVPPQSFVADLACARPDLRQAIARVQSLAGLAYAELRQDYLDAQYAPFASIRFPLSFFGMEKLEAAPPKSVRGVFLQGAPIAEDVAAGREGDWPYPLIAQPGDPREALAPLPSAGVGAVPRRLSPHADVALRIAPGELARMLQTAMQGHGASLGVAREAGALATLAQVLGEPAVPAVLSQCEAGQFAITGTRDLRDAAQRSPVRAVLRAEGGPALATAPSAFDLTWARASRNEFGLATCLVTQAAQPWLVQGLVLRCAQAGRVGIVCWDAAQAQLDGPQPPAGFALALPTVDGALLLRAALPAAAAVHRGFQCGEEDPLAASGLGALVRPAQGALWAAQLSDLLRPAAPAPGPSGYLLVVAPAPDAQAMDAVGAALDALGLRAQRLTAQEREQRERQAQERGLLLDLALFERLDRAGRALLVPQEAEPRFLPPGFDPLKGF